ncbi:hypothetical protein MLD38_008606 [Melastoma candidum]|uniref:Uncharacterized protein n=1 Tax=Melastoma candidum TaxID=119954 RepID=A0ACB9RVE7_9MYRT|nr:hypothetical protein MLD38_008606 [Melastoma candidum]
MSTISRPNHHPHPTVTSSSSSSPSASLNGIGIGRSSSSSTTHACAACKYQRRKCQPDCVLAPYFPHDRQRQFQNAHKLFGVSNITKIIRNLSPAEKDEAMRTIIFQSDARATDPVLGCFRIVRDLKRQIEYCQAELEIVLRQLEICRAQAAVAAAGRIHPHVGGCNVVDDGEFSGPHYDFVVEGGHEEDVAVVDGYGSCGDQAVTSLTDFNVAWTMQDPALFVMPFDIVDNKQGYVNGCEDMKRLLDISDDREELEFDSIVNRRDEDAVEHQDPPHIRSEDESSCVQFVQDHDLKGAATLFTLTNCAN